MVCMCVCVCACVCARVCVYVYVLGLRLWAGDYQKRLHFGLWGVVKIMVPSWLPIIIRHLIFRVPQKGS